jgi:chromosome segregation ATPase
VADSNAANENIPKGKENNHAVSKWMADKNLERKVEKLKAKLLEREKELKDVEKREGVLHTIIEKEKTRLSARVRELEAQLERYTKKEKFAHTPDWASIDAAKAMQSRIFELESEVQRLERTMEVEKAHEIRLLQHEAAQLRRKLDEQIMGSSEMSQLKLDSELKRIRVENAKLEEELVEKDGVLLELRFEKEQSNVNIGRMQRRHKELTAQVEQLESLRSDDNHESMVKGVREGGGKREKELEETVVSMKRLLEKLRLENESLRRNSHTNVQYMEMKKENKALKAKLESVESEVVNSVSSRTEIEEATARAGRLNEQLAGLKRQLKREQTEKEALATKCNELMAAQEKTDIHARQELEPKKDTQLSEVQRENTRLQHALSDQSTERQRLEEVVASLRRQLKHGQEPSRYVSSSDSSAVRHLESKLEAQQQKLSEAQRQNDRLTQELLVAQRTTGSVAGSNGSSEGARQALAEADRLRTQCSELVHEMEAKARECYELQQENQELKTELSAFDPAFWDEIEDLKLNYREAIEAKGRYEQMLEHLSQRYGFPFQPIRVG